MKVAIVHDWLVTYAGAERVLEQILQLYPQADLFSLVDFLGYKDRAFIQNKAVTTSFIQQLPMARKKYRSYLPLMPLAIEQLDLAGYDLIISSSHAVAKGVITGPEQVHISYVHSPIRYAWDMQGQYLRESGLDSGVKGWLARLILHYIRLWDTRTANGVDAFIANSEFISRRIKKCYRRECEVIYPPVDVASFLLCEEKKDFYLTASRLVPYKKVRLIVESFNKMTDKTLVVIGDGPDMSMIRKCAGSNIKLMGYQPFEVLLDYMQHARAFVFAAEEDFGIMPVEVQACGTPVIAYGKGGALETVRGASSGNAEPTGVFFYEQTHEAVCEAVNEFEREQAVFLPRNCRRNAERFSTELFAAKFKKFCDEQMKALKKRP